MFEELLRVKCVHGCLDVLVAKPWQFPMLRDCKEEVERHLHNIQRRDELKQQVQDLGFSRFHILSPGLTPSMDDGMFSILIHLPLWLSLSTFILVTVLLLDKPPVTEFCSSDVDSMHNGHCSLFG